MAELEVRRVVVGLELGVDGLGNLGPGMAAGDIEQARGTIQDLAAVLHELLHEVLQRREGIALVDRVDYDDQSPWPTAADGQGQSLHRNLPVAYGDFASSWSAADPSPGSSDTAANTDPVATDDGYVVAEGGTLNRAAPGVLANDNDDA